MDQTAADQVVKDFIHHIDQALTEAAGVAKAAKCCAESGNLQTAVKMAMEIEYPGAADAQSHTAHSRRATRRCFGLAGKQIGLKSRVQAFLPIYQSPTR